jgi:hypothetical protein
MGIITATEIDGRLNALINQRNAALDHAALLEGQIAVLKAEIVQLKLPKNPPPKEGNETLPVAKPADVSAC